LALDIIHWIEKQVEPSECDSVDFIYDHLISQSGKSLPIIYQPFNAADRTHFIDRAQILDFSQVAGNSTVLDFGPGDGWPSLIIAPFCDKVIGVDGSQLRVRVCGENAERLGILNASFHHVPSGNPLPFDDGYFDGITAASSVEQTPDPQATLSEFCRIMKIGGKLRISYEALNRYKGGQEQDMWIVSSAEDVTHVIIYDRYIDREFVRQYRLTFNLSESEITGVFHHFGREQSASGLSIEVLQELRRNLQSSCICTTRHPSGRTLVKWLKGAGFSKVLPSHNGGRFAGKLWDIMPIGDRPKDLDSVDKLLHPLVEVVTTLEAPVESDPWITAVK